jgi:hypothetical protein
MAYVSVDTKFRIHHQPKTRIESGTTAGTDAAGGRLDYVHNQRRGGVAFKTKKIDTYSAIK